MMSSRRVSVPTPTAAMPPPPSRRRGSSWKSAASRFDVPGAGDGRSLLLIACGALLRELKTLVRLNGWDHVTLRCLPAELHNRPEQIPGAVRALIEESGEDFDEILVGYGDCGTGGRLDALLAEVGARRLPGAHCYAFFAGEERFEALHEEEPGSFYLTDFLVRHFDRLVFRGLGLDRHPELLPTYFGNYRRVVYLAQTRSPALDAQARACARLLGLDFELRATGLAPFKTALAIGAGRAASTEGRELPWSA